VPVQGGVVSSDARLNASLAEQDLGLVWALEPMVFHDLRHSFASHWVARGGDLFKLQKILGHKTVQMTMRYAHLAPAAFRDDWNRLGTALAPSKGPSELELSPAARRGERHVGSDVRPTNAPGVGFPHVGEAFDRRGNEAGYGQRGAEREERTVREARGPFHVRVH
jgi:Phage integrase family